MVECNDIKDNREQVLRPKCMKMTKTTIWVRICLVGRQDPGSSTKVNISTNMTRSIVEWNKMKYEMARNSWKQCQCDAKSS